MRYGLVHAGIGCALAALTGVLSSSAAAAPRDLLDFGTGFDVAAVQHTDVKLAVARHDGADWLKMQTGHAQDWPGVTLPAPDGPWDLSAFTTVTLQVRNLGANPVTVHLRVDNTGADGVSNCNNGDITLPTGETGTLKVTLNRRPATPAVKLFGMRGYPPGFGATAGAIDASQVTGVVVFVARPSEDHAFEITGLRAEGEYVTPPEAALTAEQFMPLIDTFGQYIHRDWPGKTHSVEELQTRRDDEARELAAQPGPAGWDQYGGWAAGPTLPATGFFYPLKYQDKWWLVDPEGKLFWSNGIDCVRMLDVTPTDDRDGWFQDFPGDQPDLAEFVIPSAYTLHGYYAGRSPRSYNFAGANLKRKYGPDWAPRFQERAHLRLRSWGLNTIGNWSAEEVWRMKRTPYVVAVGFSAPLLEGSEGYWGKFRDVFDPRFAEAVRGAMAWQVGRSAGDPWCLGYFLDNEIAWGDEVSLASAALLSPATQVAKQVFVEDLKARYGDIAALNAAWGTAHESWDALLACREAPDANRARADLTAFYDKTADRYFSVCRAAVKEAAPNNLYLGCRFAWVNPRAIAAAVRYCDVVSFNFYTRSIAGYRLPDGADAPLIVGEFHFGALDRGMFHTGLVPVASQDARAAAYTDYVHGALANPAFVGVHWFQYQDEPTTGRVLDEENYQIGFVDIADTPYAETIAASREVGYGLYEYRLSAPLDE